MKTPYRYTVELQDPPVTFMVYKWPILGNPEKPESGYQVELYAYDNDNHKCSCEHGVHVRFEGKKIPDCKHVKLVLDKVHGVMNKLEGVISDHVVTLKDLCFADLRIVCEELKK